VQRVERLRGLRALRVVAVGGRHFVQASV
jgi:hypothetical protein